jgi:hypothetical protein
VSRVLEKVVERAESRQGFRSGAGVGSGGTEENHRREACRRARRRLYARRLFVAVMFDVRLRGFTRMMRGVLVVAVRRVSVVRSFFVSPRLMMSGRFLVVLHVRQFTAV